LLPLWHNNLRQVLLLYCTTLPLKFSDILPSGTGKKNNKKKRKEKKIKRKKEKEREISVLQEKGD